MWRHAGPATTVSGESALRLLVMLSSKSTPLFVTLALCLSACTFNSAGSGKLADTEDASAGSGDDTDDEDADGPDSSGPDEPNDDTGAECDDPQRFYLDADGDGFGDPGESTDACELPSGFVDNDKDCDDASAEVNPSSLEICDGFDNDCDNGVDEFSSANTQCGDCSWGVGPGGSDTFAHCDVELSWDEAREACGDFGGDLAVVSSAPVHAFVHEFASGDQWIGLADRDEEGRWVWVDGEDAMIGGVSVGFDAWDDSQPDGADTENCGLLVEGRGWADVDCTEPHVFACQVPL